MYMGLCLYLHYIYVYILSMLECTHTIAIINHIENGIGYAEAVALDFVSMLFQRNEPISSASSYWLMF